MLSLLPSRFFKTSLELEIYVHQNLHNVLTENIVILYRVTLHFHSLTNCKRSQDIFFWYFATWQANGESSRILCSTRSSWQPSKPCKQGHINKSEVIDSGTLLIKGSICQYHIVIITACQYKQINKKSLSHLHIGQTYTDVNKRKFCVSVNDWRSLFSTENFNTTRLTKNRFHLHLGQTCTGLNKLNFCLKCEGALFHWKFNFPSSKLILFSRKRWGGETVFDLSWQLFFH